MTILHGYVGNRQKPTAIMYIPTSRPARFDIDQIHYDTEKGKLMITAVDTIKVPMPVGLAGNMEFSIRDLSFDVPLVLKDIDFPSHGSITYYFDVLPFV